MKAIVLQQHGTLDNVQYQDVPIPEIGHEEVLLQVKAAALNRLDLWVSKGWSGLKLQFPHILGSDGSGVIVEMGRSVVGFKIGDRVSINPTRSCGHCPYCRAGHDNMCDAFAVFGEHIPGFYAELQRVHARNILKMPDSISHKEAAAASLVFVTAWHSLIEVGQLRMGEDILIVGAGGGVNTATIQLARLAGAGMIYVVGSSEKKLELASKLGADVTINRLREDWGKALFNATCRCGVDIVVDNVGAATFPTSLRLLKKGGRLLTVGNSSGPILELDNRYVFGKHLKIFGTTMGTSRDYENVMKLVFAGQLTPMIDTVYPVSDGLTALRRLESGNVFGKLVLQI
jgi:NADPH:quinone reductase-like Zn-dependent oxidoreductase